MENFLIVLEGASDAVGKTTQCKKLKKKLEEDGYCVITHHFPSYGSKSAFFVEEYLKGNLGTKETLTPYAISSLFAMDRLYTFHTYLKEEYPKGKIILLDRYTTSNMIYQASFFTTKEEQIAFAHEIEEYEYQKLGLPKPNMVCYLTGEEEAIERLREERKKQVLPDQLEEDKEFLHRVYQCGEEIAKTFHFEIISCSKEKKWKEEDEITEEIYQKIKEKLECKN